MLQWTRNEERRADFTFYVFIYKFPQSLLMRSKPRTEFLNFNSLERSELKRNRANIPNYLKQKITYSMGHNLKVPMKDIKKKRKMIAQRYAT
mmetsp:Transcript_26483/g.26879  ORF Transcript_26483/g.26879 Transcript_26483/m.26879 type:complete len:92 (-) Transcript_26483:86-361(-)